MFFSTSLRTSRAFVGGAPSSFVRSFSSQNTYSKIIVRNLPKVHNYDWEPVKLAQAVKEQFEQFGEIKALSLSRSDDGEVQRFCHITFDDPAAAKKAVAHNVESPITMLVSNLEVWPSQPRKSDPTDTILVYASLASPEEIAQILEPFGKDISKVDHTVLESGKRSIRIGPDGQNYQISVANLEAAPEILQRLLSLNEENRWGADVRFLQRR